MESSSIYSKIFCKNFPQSKVNICSNFLRFKVRLLHISEQNQNRYKIKILQ